LEESYLEDEIEGKCGFVTADQMNDSSYHSFCSEFYLRLRKPIEIELEQFKEIIEKLQTKTNE